jgi:GNAT superfamily N-acetyltransferase
MTITHMQNDFVLYCCLHCGFLSPSTIDDRCTLSEEQADLNKQFLTRLIETYGSCGMMAMEKGIVVAHARFWPQAIDDQIKFCCHDPNHAITQEMVEMELPALDKPEDRVMRITCYFIHAEYRGQGLSHELIEAILEWAKANDWKRIRCFASNDNHWLASEMCTPMKRTYEKYGFKQIDTVDMPEVKDFLQQMQDGALGEEKKAGFEEYCSGQDMSELGTLFEMECLL